MTKGLYLTQPIWTVILIGYALSVTLLTRLTYEMMRKRGLKKGVAIYYNRKIVHIFAGGVVLFTVPFLFTSPFYPLAIGLALTVATSIPYLRGEILYWVQTESNRNDVKFCFMWGLSVFVLWYLLGDPWIAVIPPAFMAFGDGITGVVRNMLYGRRTKSPVGNFFMAAVTIPLGYFLAGFSGLAWWGVAAAVLASVIERYELGPIDDNILITLTASAVLYAGSVFGPI